MKKSRYTDRQIISILKQNESGTVVADLCREHSMSQATLLQMALKIWRHGCVFNERSKRIKV